MMQHKIIHKLVYVYLLFAFVGLFTIAAVVPVLTDQAVIKSHADDLYREATYIATDYMSNYQEDYTATHETNMRLGAVCRYLEASIWLVDINGNVKLSSGEVYTDLAPDVVEGFRPSEVIRDRYKINDFYGCFSEDVITACVPVNVNYKLVGYVLIHKTYQSTSPLRSQLMSTVALTFAIIFLLSLGVLFAYYYIVQRPVDILVKAAKEYTTGNLGHVIPLNTQDEFGFLSNSLNTMSDQINNMDESQRQFIANISHDLRSPLTSIKGYSEAIMDGTIPPEFMEKYLKIIQFEADRLTNLTSDLMTLAKFDKKGRSFDRTNFDINEVIKTTAISFEGRCAAKRLEIELLFADQVSMVNADRSRIQQVFYNLIDNAIKFSNEDSSITIETTEQGKKLRVSVKDYGCGIPKDSVTKVFDRFYKTDLSRGRDKTGTGLGLAIVKEIIQAHGENITCISTEGVSTEFVFTLARA